MRRTPLLALLLLTGLVPADATAQVRCPKVATCQAVTVPLDRTGRTDATVDLHVAVVQPRRARRAPVLVLSGGPGQPSVASVRGWIADLGRTVLAERGLIAFDARGSGGSDVISCPAMQRTAIPRDTAAAEACAVKLGESRRFYTTIDQAEDIEAVRAKLGVPKLALYGISFGTKVAQTYARLHPDRVESLALDSAVPAEGASALSQEILGAMPRVLGGQLGRIQRLVSLLRSAPAVGVAFDPRGRGHRTTAYPAAIFDVLLAGDFNPVLRQALPAAISALVAGDEAPLMRLIYNAQEGERLPPRSTDFSAGLYAATSCEEIAFPWAPNASFAERARAAREAATRAGALGPFAAEDILTLDWIPLCLRWPRTPGPRALPAATPDVPALILNGREDLRTPLEEARAVQATLPSSRLLSIRGVGHSVVGTDPSGCARRALRAFLRARAIPSSCPAARTGFERGIKVPPRRYSGPLAKAVLETLLDAELALALSPTGEVAGGLRGGTVRYSEGPLHRMRNYQYVPGLRVSARGRTIRAVGPGRSRATFVVRDRRIVRVR